MSFVRHWCVLPLWIILVSSAALSGVRAAEPPKLHVIVVADTNDASIGESVRIDHDNVLKFLKAGFRGHEEQLLAYHVWGKTSKKELFDALDQVGKQVDGNRGDAFLVYISGHGFFDPVKEHSLKVGNDLVPRAEIRRRMEAFHPRLCLLITDSCANVPQTGKAHPHQMGGADGERPDWKTMRSLFLEARGTLDINAASKGEFALCDRSGSLFTNELLTTLFVPFDELSGNKKTVDWNQVLIRVQTRMTPEFLKIKSAVLKEFKYPLPPNLIAVEKQLKAQKNQTVRVWKTPAPR